VGGGERSSAEEGRRGSLELMKERKIKEKRNKEREREEIMKKRERGRQGEGRGQEEVKPHDDQVRCVWWERCGGGGQMLDLLREVGPRSWCGREVLEVETVTDRYRMSRYFLFRHCCRCCVA
jgi:hypothetical protein